jgi:hypothetical protein
MFDMDEKKRRLVAKLGFHDHIGLAALASCDVGKEFFVEKCDRAWLKIAGHGGKKQLDEIDEKGRQ